MRGTTYYFLAPSAGLSLDRSDTEELARRAAVTSPEVLDAIDRAARLRELRRLGLCGVREIRGRYRLIRTLKARLGGRPLTEDEMDTVTKPVMDKQWRRRTRRLRG